MIVFNCKQDVMYGVSWKIVGIVVIEDPNIDGGNSNGYLTWRNKKNVSCAFCIYKRYEKMF